jgi:hypothetical protein
VGGQLAQVVIELCDVFALGFAGRGFELGLGCGTNEKLCRGSRPLRARRR